MGIKSFRQMGLNTSSSKSLMRVLLINALSSTMAMDSMDAFAPSSLSASASPMSSSSSGFYGMVFGFVITFLCLLAGFIWVTAHFGAELQNRLQQMRVKSVLPSVLALLRGYASEHGISLNEAGEEEAPTLDPYVEDENTESEHEETFEEKLSRYQNASCEECSDDEFWRTVHHGAPTADDPASAHRRYTDIHLENIMRETNRLLNRRMARLRQEMEAAAVRNDQMSMAAIDAEMDECVHLRYDI